MSNEGNNGKPPEPLESAEGDDVKLPPGMAADEIRLTRDPKTGQYTISTPLSPEVSLSILTQVSEGVRYLVFRRRLAVEAQAQQSRIQRPTGAQILGKGPFGGGPRRG